MTALVADWSMYQSDYHGDPANYDQLYDPSKWIVNLDFRAAVSVIQGVILRVGIGTRKDPCFDRYLAGLKAAGVPWGIYHAYDPAAPGQAQSECVGLWCQEAPPLGLWGDVEMGEAVFGATILYLRALDGVFGRTAGIYSGGPYLNAHFNTAQQAQLETRSLWIAGYPNYIPPCGWNKGAGHALHQYTDKYQLPGLTHLCDMSRTNPTANWPNGDKSMLQLPMVPRGSLLGIHSIVPGKTLPVVKQAVIDGLPLPAAVILNDGGVCVDIQAASPTTRRICRYYNPADDALQDVVTWTPSQVQAWAERQLAKILTNANDAQIAATDWFICHNEPDQNDPANRAYPDGWAAMAQAWMKFIQVTELENASRRIAGRPVIHLGIGGLSQGTPEWEEMQAMFDTGLFQTMERYGHLWVVHEGAWTDQPIDTGWGDTIPGAPATPNSGSSSFRVEILYANLLRPAGIQLPLLIGEWYGGGRYTNPASDQVARMAWYDGLAANIPEVVGFCPFTSNPGPGGGWKDADYTFVYLSPELAAYRRSVANRINGANMPLTQADILGLREKFNSLAVQGSNIVAGANAGLAQLAALKPDDDWWTSWPAGVYAPPRALPLPVTSIAMRDAAGIPLAPAIMRSNAMMAFERQGELFRVLAAPINGVYWWVRGSDLPAA